MTRVRRLALLGLLAALPGCAATTGHHPPAASSPTASAAALPAEWSLHEDAPQGFSLALPDAWDVATRDSPTLDADLQALRARRPELARYFTDGFTINDQLRMIAADSRSLNAGYAVNAHVNAGDLGSTAAAPSLDEVVKARLTRLARQREVTQPVHRTSTHLAGQTAAQLEYTLATPTAKVTVRSYLITVDRAGRRRLYELTIGQPADAGRGALDDIARLFALFPPS
ncbi:MAG: hypothetical protein ABR598_06900 [Candidatus Dormibacteria bacterium]